MHVELVTRLTKGLQASTGQHWDVEITDPDIHENAARAKLGGWLGNRDWDPRTGKSRDHHTRYDDKREALAKWMNLGPQGEKMLDVQLLHNGHFQIADRNSLKQALNKGFALIGDEPVLYGSNEGIIIRIKESTLNKMHDRFVASLCATLAEACEKTTLVPPPWSPPER